MNVPRRILVSDVAREVLPLDASASSTWRSFSVLGSSRRSRRHLSRVIAARYPSLQRPSSTAVDRRRPAELDRDTPPRISERQRAPPDHDGISSGPRRTPSILPRYCRPGAEPLYPASVVVGLCGQITRHRLDGRDRARSPVDSWTSPIVAVALMQRTSSAQRPAGAHRATTLWRGLPPAMSMFPS